MKNIGLWVFVSGLAFMIQMGICGVITFPGFLPQPSNAKQDGACPINMVLYPIDSKASEFICDCRPGYVYFADSDSCHELFTQGPCPEQHYVYVRLNDTAASCEKNICSEENHVPHNGHCHQIGSTGGPCLKNQVLSINATTLQLECFQMSLIPTYIIKVPKMECPIGSRRIARGRCRKVL